MCELITRLRTVGLVQDHTCPFPITRGELSDALSISHVYANRTLQDIRKDGLIRLTKSTLTVLEWDGLKKAGEFGPTYLHLEDNRAAA